MRVEDFGPEHGTEDEGSQDERRHEGDEKHHPDGNK